MVGGGGLAVYKENLLVCVSPVFAEVAYGTDVLAPAAARQRISSADPEQRS